MAALTSSLVSRGTLAWRAPDHLEKRTEEPFVEDVVVDGDRLSYAKPADGIRRTIGLDQAPELRALVDAVRGTLAGDLAELRRVYSVGFEGSPERWRLTLVPVEPRVKELVKAVLVDGEKDEITQVDTVEPDGDRTRMTVEPLASR